MTTERTHERTIKAVFFDLFGTLLLLDPLDAACEAVAPRRGGELSKIWRARQLELSWLRTTIGTWVDFDEVTRDGLDAALDELDVAAGTDDRRRLAAAFRTLPMAAGAADVLAGLRAGGAQTGILTNAATGTLRAVAARTGLERLTDHLLSIDPVRAFKPHPSVYRLATDATGLPPASIGFVTGNGWDAAGAGAFGFRVIWLRAGPEAGIPRVGAPDPIAASWSSLPQVLLGSTPSEDPRLGNPSP
jgi:2-haloacid dehalogenase